MPYQLEIEDDGAMDTKLLPRFFMVAAAVLVLGSLALAWGLNPAKDYDPDTPEGVIQAFVTAVIDGDHVAAEALIDPSLIDPTDPNKFDRCRRLGTGRDEVTWVGIDDVRVSGDTATVEIRVSRVAAGAIDAPYNSNDSFELVRVDGLWTISRIAYQFCERW